MRFLAGAGLLLIGALVGGLSATWLLLAERSRDTCELLREEPPVTAPDGTFAAQLVHSACGGPLGGTYLPTKVLVWRTEAPHARRDVAGWEADDAGALVWIGPTLLEMRTANPWGARLRPTPFAGLAVRMTVAPPARDRLK